MNSEEFYDAETGLDSDDSLEVSFKDALVFDSSNQVTDGCAAEYAAVWRRRETLPAKMVTRSNFSVTSILRKCIGMELSKIAMPIVFNEPLSFLQRLSEYMEHTHLIHRACTLSDSIERIQVVAAFAVSAVASQWERTGKPFNPLLGETFELTREEDGYRLISEQVSHHPPISAFHAESLKQEFAFHGSVYPKLTFWGKSVEAEPRGTMTLELLKYKETYTWSNPMCCVHNVIIGKIWIEQYGTVEIVNHSTGEKCVLNFKPGGMFGKELHKVEGHIQDSRKKKCRMIYGKWTECMYSVEPKVYEAHKKSKKAGADSKKLKEEHSCDGENTVQETVTVIPGSALLWRISPRPHHSAQMYNFTSFAVTLNELEPGMERLLAPTDCRQRPDIRAMESGDLDTASAEKERLEEKQRVAHRKRSKDEKKWSTSATCASHPVDQGLVLSHLKPVVSNLGFKLDSDFKLDQQSGAVVETSSFHLRQLAMVKPFLSQQHFHPIHAFVKSRLDDCNVPYFRVRQFSPKHHLLVENAAALLLTGAHEDEPITPIRSSLNWLPAHL